MRSINLPIFVLITSFGLVGCRNCGNIESVSGVAEVGGGANTIGPSLMLDLDWDDQIRRLQNPKIDPSLLIRVHARMVRRSFPTFDVGSVGGPNDRWAIFQVIDNETIPRYPKVRRVFLSTTLAGLVSQFLSDDEVYTLIFNRDLKLYDVVDSHGRSPKWRATTGEP